MTLGPDLGPNCLQRVSSDNISRSRFSSSCYHKISYLDRTARLPCKKNKFMPSQKELRILNLFLKRQQTSVFHQKIVEISLHDLYIYCQQKYVGLKKHVYTQFLPFCFKKIYCKFGNFRESFIFREYAKFQENKTLAK